MYFKGTFGSNKIKIHTVKNQGENSEQKTQERRSTQ